MKFESVFGGRQQKGSGRKLKMRMSWRFWTDEVEAEDEMDAEDEGKVES